jgi:hypothetical protein
MGGYAILTLNYEAYYEKWGPAMKKFFKILLIVVAALAGSAIVNCSSLIVNCS